MLDSTLDLISQVVSKNLYVFCIFNLIIVTILMGSKQGSNFNQDYEIPVSAAPAPPSCDKQQLEVKQLLNRSEQAAHASKVSSACETAMEGANTGGNGDGDGDEDYEEDDELRRRVEEFIAKVNREWRAEKLGMSISA